MSNCWRLGAQQSLDVIVRLVPREEHSTFDVALWVVELFGWLFAFHRFPAERAGSLPQEAHHLVDVLPEKIRQEVVRDEKIRQMEDVHIDVNVEDLYWLLEELQGQ